MLVVLLRILFFSFITKHVRKISTIILHMPPFHSFSYHCFLYNHLRFFDLFLLFISESYVLMSYFFQHTCLWSGFCKIILSLISIFVDTLLARLKWLLGQSYQILENGYEPRKFFKIKRWRISKYHWNPRLIFFPW